MIGDNNAEEILDAHTTGYRIGGKPGTWAVCDSCILDGEEFYLMESEDKGAEIPYVVITALGEVAVHQCCLGFTPQTVQAIMQYMTCKRLNEDASCNEEKERHTADNKQNMNKPRSLLQRLKEKQRIIEDWKRGNA